MKYTWALCVLLLTGCTTVPVPVTVKFPSPPEKAGAMTTCEELKKLKQDPVLSDVSRTVNENYSTYYGCVIKVDTWIEWYQIQKNIFEGAVK